LLANQQVVDLFAANRFFESPQDWFLVAGPGLEVGDQVQRIRPAREECVIRGVGSSQGCHLPQLRWNDYFQGGAPLKRIIAEYLTCAPREPGAKHFRVDAVTVSDGGEDRVLCWSAVLLPPPQAEFGGRPAKPEGREVQQWGQIGDPATMGGGVFSERGVDYLGSPWGTDVEAGGRDLLPCFG
jgi:hypothetical protein